MKTETIELLGLSFHVSGRPETSAELNTRYAELTGKPEDVAREEAVANLDYRSYYGKLRGAISKAVDKVCPRDKTVSEGKSGAPITKYKETEAKHIQRGIDDGFISAAEVAAIGQAWVDANPWDVTVLTEASRSTKLPKEDVAAAEKLLGNPNTDWGVVETKFQAVLGESFVLDVTDSGAPEVNYLAGVIGRVKATLLASAIGG